MSAPMVQEMLWVAVGIQEQSTMKPRTIFKMLKYTWASCILNNV